MSTHSSMINGAVRRYVKSGARSWGRLTAPIRPLPDFLVVGAKRGGTTSLWNWLLAHPQMIPMFPAAQNLKSSHYFYMHFDKGPAWYRGFFRTSLTRRRRLLGPRTVTGEASPYYLFDPRVPQRIHQLMPDVKIIILLRDPVERAYSHYRERVHEGVETLSFSDALTAESDRLRGEEEHMREDPFYYSRPHDWFSYASRGEYAAQVSRYLEIFPRENVHIVQSEDLYRNPQVVFNSTTDFLGLQRILLKDPPVHNYHPHNQMSDVEHAMLSQHYHIHNEKLYKLLGLRFEWTR